MKPATPDTAIAAPKAVVEKIIEVLQQLVSEVPTSDEGASHTPSERGRSLTLKASAKAALVSGTLSLPPGPLGMLTILPDLLAIWRIQQQLVADVAAANGKTAQLGQAEMIYCLFKHATGQAVRDLVLRAGERFIVRRPTLRVIQRVLRRVGVSVTQRATGRAVSRWLPVVGAVGIGGYAFYDTTRVGRTATEVFERRIVHELEPSSRGSTEA